MALANLSSTRQGTRIGDAERPVVTTIQSPTLFLLGTGETGDERFAAVFRATIRMIPAAPRSQLMSHWREDPLRKAVSRAPEILLANTWDRRHGGGRDAIGHCLVRGHRLCFHAPTIEVLPRWCIEELIAHELAHTLQYATIEETDLAKLSEDNIEADARNIEESWGFDPHAAHSWYLDNRVMLGLNQDRSVDARARQSCKS